MRLFNADAFFNDFPELRDYEYASQEYEVDAEPVRHGHWVEAIKGDYEWECSSCGWGLSDYKTAYCYDCGAKMDEDRDYEHAVEQLEHDMTFDPTYNPEDGSM